MKIEAQSVILGIFILLMIGLLVVITLCFTGVIKTSSAKKCGTHVEIQRESVRVPEYQEIAFSAAVVGIGGGTVDLTWSYDTTESGSLGLSFLVNIWYSDPSGSTPPPTSGNGKIITLVSAAPASGQAQYYYNSNTKIYSATLDGSNFQADENWVTIAAQITANGNTLQSSYTAATTVTVEAAITSVATFASLYFVACGYTSTDNEDITPTYMKLMLKQTHDPSVQINQFCYQITVEDAGALGFTSNYTSNGFNVAVLNNTIIQITATVPSTSTSIITVADDCCCYTDPTPNSVSIFKYTNNVYYISILSDAVVDAAVSSQQNLKISTFMADCITPIAPITIPLDATAYIIGSDIMPTLTPSCKPSCAYVDGIANNNFPDITNCTEDPYTSTTLSAFSGGASVTISINDTFLPSNLYKLYKWGVEESVINATPADYTAYTDDSPIIWNLPSGYYTPSCTSYAAQMDNGSYIPVSYVKSAAFQVNLTSPGSLTTVAE